MMVKVPLSKYAKRSLHCLGEEASRFIGSEGVVTPVYLLLTLLRWRFGIARAMLEKVAGSTVNLQGGRLAWGRVFSPATLVAELPGIPIRKLVTRARRCAAARDRPRVSTGHLLLVLLEAEDQDVAKLLQELKIDSRQVRRELLVRGFGVGGTSAAQNQAA